MIQSAIKNLYLYITYLKSLRKAAYFMFDLNKLINALALSFANMITREDDKSTLFLYMSKLKSRILGNLINRRTFNLASELGK